MRTPAFSLSCLPSPKPLLTYIINLKSMTLDDSTLASQSERDSERSSLTLHTIAHLKNEQDSLKSKNYRVETDRNDSSSNVDELEEMLVRAHQQRLQWRLAQATSVSGTSRPASTQMSEAAMSFANIKWRQVPGVPHHSSCHAKIESQST